MLHRPICESTCIVWILAVVDIWSTWGVRLRNFAISAPWFVTKNEPFIVPLSLLSCDPSGHFRSSAGRFPLNNMPFQNDSPIARVKHQTWADQEWPLTMYNHFLAYHPLLFHRTHRFFCWKNGPLLRRWHATWFQWWKASAAKWRALEVTEKGDAKLPLGSLVTSYLQLKMSMAGLDFFPKRKNCSYMKDGKTCLYHSLSMCFPGGAKKISKFQPWVWPVAGMAGGKSSTRQQLLKHPRKNMKKTKQSNVCINTQSI